ncbi:MAG: hypothetical protein A2Y34_12490 [Spirochaetes bacterium GWC1_27_15]|nr:MAG: hypothetical protein A2Y34_12490 [Spirochaetes bacterium GWC1_27_15]
MADNRLNRNKIEKYFPKGVLEKITNFEDNIFELVEKRYATVMFVDISGYTAISEKLKPEEVVEFINKCFASLIGIVEKYNGYVDKFIGDCLLCVFGISSFESPELSATFCAIEMQDAINSLNIQLKGEYSFDLYVTIGIHCGDLILGNIGCESRMDYTIIGDTVNTASRIQKEALPSEILLSDELYQKVKNYINVETLNPVKVKNKNQSLTLHKLLSKKELKPTVIQKEIMIGRDNELKLIINEYEKENPEKLIILSGESGIGKSLIVENFLNHIEKDDIFIFSTGGSLYTKQFYWQPFKEIYNNFALIIDWVKDSKDKTEIEKQSNLIFDFFNQHNTSVTKHSIFESFRIFLNIISKIKKIVIIIDDINYIDDISLELLEYLLRTLKKSNIFFLLTKKSDFNLKTNDYNIIELKGLSDFECNELLEFLLKGKIDNKLNNYIYEYSLGNPLYIIEIITALNKNRFIEYIGNNYYIKENIQKDKINPQSLTNLILNKIDTLDFKEKRILIISSFFGRTIRLDILKKIVEFDNIDNIISNIVKKGYFTTKNINNDQILYFNNQLTIEALYNSVVEKKKKEIHLKIANCLLKEYENNLFFIYEIIAYHFEQAESYFETVYYYFLAAMKYRETYDFETAKKCFAKSLYFAEKEQSKTDDVIIFNEKELKFKDFRATRIFFYINVKFKLSIDIIYYFYAQSLFFHENNIRTFYEKALSYSQKIKNDFFVVLEKVALFNIKNFFYHQNMDTTYLNEALVIAEKIKNKILLIYIYAEHIDILIRKENLVLEPKHKEFIDKFLMAKKIIESLDNIDEKYKNNFLLYWYWFCSVYYKKINKDLKTIFGILNICETLITNDYQKMFFYERICLGTGPLVDTEYQVEYIMKALEIGKKTNNFLKMAHLYSTLAYLYLKNKDYQKSLEANLLSKKICEEIDNRLELGMIYKNLGDLYLTLDKFDNAIESYQKSILYKKEFSSTRTVVDFANVIFPLTSLTFLHIKKDAFDEADNNLFKIYELLTNYTFGKEVPTFAEFLRNFLEYKKNKKDFVYLQRMKDCYYDMVKNSPNTLQLLWIKKELGL